MLSLLLIGGRKHGTSKDHIQKDGQRVEAGFFEELQEGEEEGGSEETKGALS